MARRRRPASTDDRILGALVAGLSVLGLLWLRCAWLQVVGAHRYAALARAQQHLTQILPARRGILFDRNARPLAVSVPVPSVYANARQVAAKRQVAAALGQLVGRDARMIERRLARDKGFVWVARQVDAVTAPDLLPFRDDGIGLLEEPKRFYPQGTLASQLVGFVDIDSRGLEGLELAYNGALRGEAGWRQTLRDARGEPIIGPWTVETPPIDGLDVVLTIDGVVQQVAEETLAWGVQKYHAKGGCIIVLEPSSGAVLAIANAPTFDPNAPADAPIEARRDRAVTDVFEPGSIFKIVTASALLDLGRVRPDEVFFCENGAYRIPGGHMLHDHKPHGNLPFFDVIKYSSNIGTAKAAQRLTPDELYRYIRAFGFGQATGIELPGEVRGLLSPPAQWSKTSPYIIPIGQEVATTPLQLAVMTAVVANGGLRVRPYVVDRVQAPDGRVIRRYGAREAVRIISPDTARILQDMLRSVVESGTGQLANVQGLTVAGKTGTAQKLEPTGRYSHSRFVASFVGFGPVPDARFVAVVSVDEPRPLYFGGTVSAPMFKRMVERLRGYWELPIVKEGT